MGKLIDGVVERLDGGADPAALLGYLSEAVGDAGLLGSEFPDLEDPVRAAEADERAVEAWIGGALKTFPMNTETFPHSAHIDPRAQAALASLALAKRSGLYVPSELRTMREEEAITEEWHAREALRFRIYAALVRARAAAMEEEELSAANYAADLLALAERLNELEIEVPARGGAEG